MMVRFWGLFFLLTASCLPQVGPRIDAGIAVDGGALSPACSDAALGTDESDVDCGGPCPPCSLSARCTSSFDCSSGLCAQGFCGAPDVVCTGFAGCGSFVDLQAESRPTIRFPEGNNRYSPQCARIRLGQTVVFEGGDFGTHTLRQSCGPVRNTLQASSGLSFEVTFDKALGVFGYYCSQHGSNGGSGMAGAIEVVR